jgi:hypothetical protein
MSSCHGVLGIRCGWLGGLGCAWLCVIEGCRESVWVVGYRGSIPCGDILGWTVGVQSEGRIREGGWSGH